MIVHWGMVVFSEDRKDNAVVFAVVIAQILCFSRILVPFVCQMGMIRYQSIPLANTVTMVSLSPTVRINVKGKVKEKIDENFIFQVS